MLCFKLIRYICTIVSMYEHDANVIIILEQKIILNIFYIIFDKNC